MPARASPYEFTDIATGRCPPGFRSWLHRHRWRIDAGAWNRPKDSFGLAGVNGTSSTRRAYPDAGGLGILVANRRLPNPDPEKIRCEPDHRALARNANGNQHKPAARNRDERKRPNAGAALLALAVPTDGKREDIGNRKIDEVLAIARGRPPRERLSEWDKAIVLAALSVAAHRCRVERVGRDEIAAELALFCC